jgi:hypothetical protein
MNVPVGQLTQLPCPARGFVVPAVITNAWPSIVSSKGLAEKVKVSEEVVEQYFFKMITLTFTR